MIKKKSPGVREFTTYLQLLQYRNAEALKSGDQEGARSLKRKMVRQGALGKFWEDRLETDKNLEAFITSLTLIAKRNGQSQDIRELISSEVFRYLKG